MTLKDLAAEFPRAAVHWRAQTLTKTGDKALALAYLDARDVMDRLDEVCGPQNWQSEFVETERGRVICRIGVKVGDEWIWKSDGAGATDVEGEKGGISDALKRAAVQWGIGRYLYRLDAVWAPCETYERNGKKVWSKWRGSPWDCVHSAPKADTRNSDTPAFQPEAFRDRVKANIEKARTLPDLYAAFREAWGERDNLHPAMVDELTKAKDVRKAELSPPDPAMQAPDDGHVYQ